MITIRKSEARGRGDRGWLKSHFTFSFADFHDPEFSGFRALKVMNEDRIEPGKGFGPHAHRDMEIITFVLEGRLAHRDSMSGAHTVGPNEIQTMSAGTGVVHSEANGSETEPVHLMQIWIEPASEDMEPSYQQVAIPPDRKRGRLHLLAGPAGGPAAATTINQDARLYVADRRNRAATARTGAARLGAGSARTRVAERHAARRGRRRSGQRRARTDRCRRRHTGR
jgi:redox-sensitive bicupin YhaK (pirin superfamily)